MSVLQLSLLLLGVFVFSALAAHLLALVRAPAQAPLTGGIVKIKTTRGVYRSKFRSCDVEGWQLSSPIGRSGFVHFCEGDDVVIEVPVCGGALLARTRVRKSDEDSQDLLVARPRTARRIERREMRRVGGERAIHATLEGQPASLLDLSPLGARLECSAAIACGERVKLELGDRDEPLFGWVLEVLPVASAFGRRTMCRLSFEERVPLPSSTSSQPLKVSNPTP